MPYMLLCLLLVGFSGGLPALAWASAGPRVEINLQADPATHAFTCRYTLALPAVDSATVLRLNLGRQLHLTLPAGATVRLVYYPYLNDTLQQVQLRVPAHHARRLTLAYTGTLGAAFATTDVLEFSGHSGWLPFRPGGEYEAVDYALTVQVPPDYHVRSTRPARHQRPGQYTFAGQAGATEPTALVARQFAEATTPRAPYLTVSRAGASQWSPADSALLQKARDIVGFYNHTLGRLDSISRFWVLLPGTNRDAFALLDNAVVITYRDFDMQQRDDLLILAHEISHKWWTYGSVHNADDWLNEAFATYSSLLYLRARGDTAGYRQTYARLVQTTPGTPPILGFDRFRYEPGMYRRVVYNKGTVVLAALHARVGTPLFYRILATTAGRHVRTTAAWLALVGEVAGPDTRAWLLAELRR